MKKPITKTSRLRLVQEEVDIDTDTHACVVQFGPEKGQQIRVPRENLGDRHAMQREILRRGGRKIDDLQAQCDRLLAERAPVVIQTTGRGGWYQNVFVTAFGTFGDDASIRFVDNGSPVHASPSGTLKDYLKGLRAPLTSSNYLALMLSAALTPALAGRIGEPGGGFLTLSQTTSAGKTTALRVAHSALARAREEDLISLNMSENWAVRSLVAYGGMLVAFKDVKAASGSKLETMRLIHRMAFSAHDHSQRRTMLSAAAPVTPSYSIAAISTERPLSELFREAGRRFEGGDAVRMHDIPVPSPGEGGIFDKLPEGTTSTELVARTQNVIDQNYGVLIPAWIKHLLTFSADALKAKAGKLRARFIEEARVSEPALRRVADFYSLIAAAGHIAAKAGLFPIKPKQVVGAVMAVFERACIRVMDADDQIKAKAIELLTWLDEGEFPVVKKGAKADQEPPDAFRRTDSGKTYLMVRREAVLARFPSSTYLEHVLLRELTRTGVLKGSGRNFTVPIKVGATRKRYYKICVRTLQEVLNQNQLRL